VNSGKKQEFLKKISILFAIYFLSPGNILGTNHVHYCHKYFVGYMPEMKEITIDPQNHHMVREIGNIGGYYLNDRDSQGFAQIIFEKRMLT
jgi:hypothetical protein